MSNRRVVGYVVRLGRKPGEGVYLSIRLRVMAGISKSAPAPNTDQMNVMLCREKLFATKFPSDEIRYAQALANKYNGRIVPVVRREEA